jgi:PAS domain S-box-containing protein
MRNESEKKLLESEVALQRALEEIKKSETKLRQAIDTIPALAWCNLPDGTNEFLNKGWHEYTGLSPEQSHGWGWQVAFHPEDLPPLMNRWREMLASGEPGETEARLRRYDGAYRWFLIRAQPLRDEIGKVVRWYGTSTDIDDRKRAEQKLQESEENLRTITDAIRQSIAVLAPDGTILYLNQVFREQTGLTMREAHDKTLHTRIFHPDDLGRALAERQKGLLRGTPFEYEARNLMKDGQYRWWLIQGNPLKDEHGQIIRWYSTGTDIDDRKRVEEALRASEFNARMIVDGIPGLVARISPAGEVEVVNRPLLDYFGKDLEGIRNWANSDNIYPDDLPLAIETLTES